MITNNTLHCSTWVFICICNTNYGSDFFSLNNIVLALFGSAELLADSGLSDTSAGHGDHLAQPDSDNQVLPGQARMVLAQNYPSQTAVRLAMEEARDAGAKILVEASSTFWGGYHGVFADPDGHIWELAHNPFFPLAPDGSVDLPE